MWMSCPHASFLKLLNGFQGNLVLNRILNVFRANLILARIDQCSLYFTRTSAQTLSIKHLLFERFFWFSEYLT
jgi:hypothetical protein